MKQISVTRLILLSDVNPELHQLNIDADNRIQVSHLLYHAFIYTYIIGPGHG